MARRKSNQSTNPISTRWKVGMYLRLSREDERAEESESIENQRKILQDALPGIFGDEPYEVIDEYVDDGISGTTDTERVGFQRMMDDATTKRVNCIIVKNLSRAFRNANNQGRILQEVLPLLGTRFISLYEPVIDTGINPDSVYGIEVTVNGWINDLYCQKISADIRKTFEQKRKNGEFIGAFAPYGYAKDPEDKNRLIVDEDAAQVVRDVFSWFVTDGMSKMGIAKRLNDLGVPSPMAYKRAKGMRYNNPHTKQNDGLWNPSTISRMLQDPLYIGTMRQGRQRVISYKVHKRETVPESDWFIKEDVVPPIIDRELFDAAQELHNRDTRTAPGKKEVYLFSGLLRCPDCGKSMTRHASRGYVYYHCRTKRDKGACTKHSIRLDVLEKAVLVTVQKQIELVASLGSIIEEINAAPVLNTESKRLNALYQLRTKELDKATAFADGLYVDWKSGEIPEDRYRRLKAEYAEKIERLQTEVKHIEDEREVYAQGISPEDPYLTTFLKHRNIQSLSRGLLVELVNTIYIHEGGEVEIDFNFADQYRRIVDFIENNKNELHVIGEKTA